MKRRQFLKTSLAASAATGLSAATMNAQSAINPGPVREYYELRIYHLAQTADHEMLDGYLEKAAIPALNRLGAKPVGVFKEKEPKEPAVYAVVPYSSVESFASAGNQINADGEYQKVAAEYLQRPKSNPVFKRIDSWLLLAFAGMPKLELPSYCREKKPRLFELRTYQSYSEAKAAKKVEMFNSGEIDVMHEVGLAPIFYGQALIGQDLPHLTYMTSGENEEVHKRHWDGFGKHPVWVKLKDDPQYADTVIMPFTKRILIPTSYSQI